MNLSHSTTDPSIYSSHSAPGMRPYQDTSAPARSPWVRQQSEVENYSLYSENKSMTDLYNATVAPTSAYSPLGGHTVWQVILIVFFTGLLSLVTIIGNILVLVSFKVNKQLKTVNNYYLLSLAFADLIIGIISMNLYTTYLIMNQWALGNWACDLWLAIDYVASNASVMNLLVISFDRYFSVTRPLTYRAKRTTKRAVTMIVLAWSISFVLWAPAILFWQYFVGERTVPPGKCYIQFLSEPIITFCTAIAAFYLPVTIMSVLYWRIYKETENRSKELAGLRGSGNQGEPAGVTPQTGSSRSCSSYELNRSRSKKSSARRIMGRFRLWTTTKSGRHGNEGEPEHSSSDSWNNNDAGASMDQSDSDEEEVPESRAIYSIVLNLPGMKAAASSKLTSSDHLNLSEDDPLNGQKSGSERALAKDTSDKEDNSYHQHFSKTQVQSMPAMETSKTAPATSLAVKSPTVPISFKDAAVAKRFASKAKTQIAKRKKMSLVKEKKAAQTLSAILFAFIITWTPYNIMVLVNTFCNDCIPEALWALGYWLCYVNSTVNPMCYALCNKTFRTTFKMILLCQWDKKRRNKQQFLQRQSVVFRKKLPGDP
ncbi:muscarinic acetylcholine receptor M3-like [Scleropages formosus]|uniref:Muscarinic acetylcholine receptor n=1 Tax=Scleropages formosus TaxID=113540 RepID=A0A0P7Z149_SCLFO|nr:muscarinic acetylcholine receptor M3 [Scleropages formosus]KPP74115.1 muscarinic acetylcholine receptor M3-like [Scleropages formosus]